MDPAPGYDPRLPHDAAHFIAENALGIKGGVFGQLTAGGMWGTFFARDVKNRRKAKKQSQALFKENKADALFSEHAVYAAQSRWENTTSFPIPIFPIPT